MIESTSRYPAISCSSLFLGVVFSSTSCRIRVLVVTIYREAGKQEFYLKQRPEELEKLVEIAKIQSTEASNAIEGKTPVFQLPYRLLRQAPESQNPISDPGSLSS